MNTTHLPYILMTNDDGIHASGIKFLYKILKKYADITVAAPYADQSAVSLSRTIRSPLRMEKSPWSDPEEDIWCVTGTPIDCVKLALSTIVKRRPDIVISGINRGSNSGRNVLYSGTVGAAIESVMQNIPAIAFSCEDYHTDPDYARTEKYIVAILRYVLNHPLPEGTLLNVNFPQKHLQIKGFKMTSQGSEVWVEDPDKRFHHAENHFYYWLGSKLKPSSDAEEGDGKWLRQGYITAVPIHVMNLTDFRHLQASQSLFESYFEE